MARQFRHHEIEHEGGFCIDIGSYLMSWLGHGGPQDQSEGGLLFLHNPASLSVSESFFFFLPLSSKLFIKPHLELVIAQEDKVTKS